MKIVLGTYICFQEIWYVQKCNKVMKWVKSKQEKCIILVLKIYIYKWVSYLYVVYTDMDQSSKVLHSLFKCLIMFLSILVQLHINLIICIFTTATLSSEPYFKTYSYNFGTIMSSYGTSSA